MKLSTSLVPYITFKLGLQQATAFVEPETTTQTNVALASFVDTTALPPSNTAFFQSSDADVPATFSADLSVLENSLGLKAGSTMIDGRSGKIVSLDLKQPILPGDGVGNNLLWGVGEGHAPPSTPEEWVQIGVEAVKQWLLDHQTDLQIDASNELFPTQSNLFDGDVTSSNSNIRSVVHGGGDTIQISMRRTFKGVTVVESRATATIKSGNLVNIGLEKWGDIDESFNVDPRLTEEDAYNAIAINTGLTLVDEVSCKPELQIITISQGDLRSNSLRSSVQLGQGYAHRLVWRVCPEFEGQGVEKMEGIVDATNGEVLSFQDMVDYFQAVGDVYPFSNDKLDDRGSLQADWPMPFMQIGNGFTDTGGNFDVPGSQTARLTGPYVEMRDFCGSSSGSVAELTQSDGIDFGGSGGTDCVTPGIGSASNTHSSRSGFYELNKIMEIARSHLPSNGWLQSKLLSYMNRDNSCNAYWFGSVNFYRSSTTCANTGELAGVFVHEWGHGMDANDVQGGIAEPSGEGIADVYTALRLHDSCIGRGFFKSQTCTGNGNPCDSCTGVRDIDYMKRSNKSPTTYTWANNNCGGQVHCLGYVYSEAVWSLYHRELNSFYGYDDNTSLEIVTRLTYIAAGNIETWFSGYTQSPSGIWRGGCGSNSGYKAYLAADDDNGDITDGTPHMQAIFKSFNDQEIACDTPAVQDSGCAGTPTDAPLVTIVEGNMKATLQWTAVAGASKYQVYRTEGLDQCEQGKVLLATLDSSILTYTDEGLANGRKYHYVVIPKGANDSCFGPASSCTSVTPVAGPGIEITCENDPLAIQIFSEQTPAAEFRNCVIYGVGGFTGTVNVGCDASSLPGVSCNVSPSSVSVSSTPITSVLSIEATSAADGAGSITVSANSGSFSSSSTIPVAIVTAGGAQVATYDSYYKAPRCIAVGTECSSGDLLDGRGAMTGGNEQNAPNTVSDSCADGNSGTYHSDESLDKIVVRSGFADGQGAGEVMYRGGRATITATVFSWNSGTADWADFYYASDDDTEWKYIATKQPSSGGIREISVDYQLPQASIHRVRVNFRYNGSVSPCSSGSYDDHDDLIFAVAADTGTLAPVTVAPTPYATNQPVVTLNPTRSPSKMPTNIPTMNPTSPPTKLPTTSPSSSPSLSPSRSPSRSPSTSPSFTPSQVTNSPTSKPTAPPTSSPLASSPVSSAPTSTGSGQQDALFDVSFGVPRCASVGSACSSGSLLTGRANLGPEQHQPNTLGGADQCKDGASGTYHSDESLDKVVVRSGEIDGSGSNAIMVEGGRATIIATVFAWASGASDTADFFYTSDASNPDWQYIGSVTPAAGGEQDLKIAYNLPQGRNQAVRVQFRYGGSINTCTSGSYNDRDDLMFTVRQGTSTPTQSPIKTPPPTEAVGGGPQQALYDSSLTVPRCRAYGSECDSLALLKGRGTMSNGAETNKPNTLGDVCTDGNSGSYLSDESIEKIVVRSGEIDGSGSGVDMMEGGRATIIATVYPFLSGSSDYADFYYASDSSNPVWQFIATKQPAGGGLQELKVDYNLPAGKHQAVRVNFRYSGAQGTNGACSGGSWDDIDDLAFGVKANPSFTGVPSQMDAGTAEEPKDITVDAKKRNELRANQSKNRKGSKSSKNSKRKLRD